MWAFILKDVLVGSVGAVLTVSQAAAQGKVSTVFLSIHLCSSPQWCMTGRTNSSMQRTAGFTVYF